MALTDFKLTDAVLRRMLHDQMDKLAEMDMDTEEDREKLSLQIQRCNSMEGLAAKVLDIEKVRHQAAMLNMKADKYYRSGDDNGKVHIQSDFFEADSTKRLSS